MQVAVSQSRFDGVDPRFGRSLASLFSASNLRSIADQGHSNVMDYVLRESGFSEAAGPVDTLGERFEQVYQYLLRYYRCEYVYKNLLVEKLVFGKHSPNSATMIGEFRVGERKADAVLLNGTSCGFEIKTELDSLDRLEHQLTAYMAVFDRVFVVTHESMQDELLRKLPPGVGLLCLTRRLTFREARAPASRKGVAEPRQIMNSLRRKEYTEVVQRVFGAVPDVSNGRLHAECSLLFDQMPPDVAHDEMVRTLFLHRTNPSLRRFVTRIPGSLRAAALMVSLDRGQMERLTLRFREREPVTRT